MINYFNELSNIELFFLVIGFAGQGLFASRFIVLNFYYETHQEMKRDWRP